MLSMNLAALIYIWISMWLKEEGLELKVYYVYPKDTEPLELDTYILVSE